MPSERSYTDRRTLLGTLGTGAILTLAGCAGNGEDTTEPEPEPESEPESEEESEPEPEDDPEQLDEPTEFPEGEECAVCNMVTPEYPEWNAQLVKANGTRVYFCSSGCMLAYVADPEHFGGEDEEVENAWVTDYETEELIDGTNCHYVRVEDSDHVDDIMMMNPTPFETRESAEAFVDELNDEHGASYDSDADIITFEDFDMELAMMYRGRFFEDGDDDGHDHDG